MGCGRAVDGRVRKGVAAAQAWAECSFYGRGCTRERRAACAVVRLYSCVFELSWGAGALPSCPALPCPCQPDHTRPVSPCAGDFSVLLAAINVAGLEDVLSDPNLAATVFAPTDAAFAALLEDLKLNTTEQLCW